MDELISETVEYTQQRKTFGKSVLDNQAIQFRLGELVTEVEALRALTYMAVGRLHNFELHKQSAKLMFVYHFRNAL